MLINVETFLLDALVDAQAKQLLDAEEEDDATGGCPEVDNEYAEALCSEESPSEAIEGTVRGRQQTSHDGSKYTTYAMY